MALRFAPSSRMLSRMLGKCRRPTTAYIHIDKRILCTDSTDSTERSTPKVSPSWVESSLVPAAVRPYLYLARVDKQVGTLLLMWPCFWSTCLAAPMDVMPDLALLTKFAVGSFVMRGAGCTINDLWDKDFDKHVERTKNR
jgi:4-hydroxybenzoate polyprenyltransferase